MAVDSPAPLPFLRGGVAQVALVVKDLQQAMRQYWRLFGIGPWHIYTYGRPLVKAMSYRGEPAHYKLRVGLSWLGPLRIELIQPIGGPSVFDEFVRAHGQGMHHLGVLVEDMDRALAQARAAGVEMTMDGSGFGKRGDGHYAYLDTEALIGTTVELICRPSERMPPEAVYPSD
jgi:catechol 2,3-dioxygenase-like lactoylglutathione lyase family enzyme